MIQLVYIPNEKIDEAWHHVESNIADALARSKGYALASNFKEWIKEKKMQLWILWDKENEHKY